MSKKSQPVSNITINVERDLKKNMRTISQRLNANPDIARLVIVNPILALEDVGVTLSPLVKKHVMNSLRFPPKLVARRDELAKLAKQALEQHGFPHVTLPLTSAHRATLVFSTLGIKPLLEDKENKEELSSERLKAYSDKHPTILALTEYERFSKGGQVFMPRNIYEEFKSGQRPLHWIKAITFKA